MNSIKVSNQFKRIIEKKQIERQEQEKSQLPERNSHESKNEALK